MIKAAARLTVEAITSYEADLEEVFLSFYQTPPEPPHAAEVRS